MTESTGRQTWDMLRAQIDLLDERIVVLLAERAAVVTQIGRYKREHGLDEAAVRSPARVEKVIERVRQLAEKQGMDPLIAERTYRALIEALTDMQLGLRTQSG